MQLRLPVAKIGEIAVGKSRSFRYGVRNGIAFNDDGVIKAYVNFCAHMGGPVDLIDGCQFRCRWHEATFDAKSGERLTGQASEGSRLTPITLQTEGDTIFALLELNDSF
mgnify:CR=1 FL=1